MKYQVSKEPFLELLVWPSSKKCLPIASTEVVSVSVTKKTSEAWDYRVLVKTMPVKYVLFFRPRVHELFPTVLGWQSLPNVAWKNSVDERLNLSRYLLSVYLVLVPLLDARDIAIDSNPNMALPSQRGRKGDIKLSHDSCATIFFVQQSQSMGCHGSIHQDTLHT